jgi:autotransporter-associated beta strand protein
MSIRKFTRTAAAASVLALAASRAAAQSSTFYNPLAPGGDPWVQLYNGTYYYTDTTGGDLMVASSSTLPGVLTAPMTDVLHMPSGFGNVWAPELHYVPAVNRWFAYFSATTPSLDHRMYAAESATSSPTGSWSFLGQITDPTNDWAIDGTTLTTSSGNMYCIWSGWPGGSNGIQNLYVAPMSTPSAIPTAASRVLISSPTNAWERVGGNGNSLPYVNEGPEILTSPTGVTTLIYSASGSFTDSYCLGMLTLTGSDPSQASSWTKDSAGPVFQSGNGVYAPGHASFTTTDNGSRDWIVYHANVQSIASGGTVFNRNVRTQPFSWNPDGTPSFGQPVAVTVPIQYGPVSWVGAINESNDDSVHEYLNTANWLNGTVTDSFANVTITDNTTLYFSADHATTGDMVLTYGSGQKFLSFQSDTNGVTRTLTLNGNLDVAVLGGANSLYFSTPARPLTIALGSVQRSFNISSTGTVFIQGGLTGTAGLNLIGGGELILQGAKTYSGPTVITQGTLSAGDGTTASSVANLPAATVVTISTSGSLLLPGLAAGGANETIAGLAGNGAISAPSSPVTLTIAPAAAYTFSGSIAGSQLSLTEAGPGTQTFSGTGTYTGLTLVTGGTLHITGPITATSGLRLTGGAAAIDTGGSVVTTGFSSVALNAGNTGTLTVGGGTTAGTLTVNGDFNIGDNGTGSLAILAGATIQTDTLFVGKFGSAVGMVNQTGGTISSILGVGGDWRIGGTANSAGAVGTYNLSGGSFSTLNNFQIGAYGAGTVNQTGGTAAVSGFISIGRYPGATGVYNLSAGSLTGTVQPLLIVGEQGTGTLNLSGTGAVIANTLAVGLNGGAGKVDQTGGTVSAPTGVTLGQTAGGTGTYVLSGGTLSTPSITKGAGTATFTFDGGTLKPTSAANLFPTPPTLLDRGGIVIDTGSMAINVTPVVAHDPTLTGTDGGVTKLGPGSLTLNAADTCTGNTNVSAGTLAFTADTGSTPLIRPVGNLTIAAGAALVDSATAGAVPAASANSTARTLVVATGLTDNGTLNLVNGDLDVQHGNLSAITTEVAAGYNLTAGGNWTGTGITSSIAAGSTHLTAVGVILNTAANGSQIYPSLDTEPLSATDVIARYTWTGDANLDGKVDGSDYTLIDAGYWSHGSLTGWYNGDFSYDGVVDGSDYTLIDNAFNDQGTPLSPSAVAATAIAEAAGPAAFAGPAAVPEPGCLAGVAAIAITARRLRRARPGRASVSAQWSV